MRVTHLTVQRGLVLATRRSARMGLLTGGDTESLRLGVGLVEMLALPNADSDPPDGIALNPRTWVLTPGGDRLRLRGVRVIGELRRVTHVIAQRRGARPALLAVSGTDELSAEGLRMAADAEQRLPVDYRRDEEIESDLIEALQRSLDLPEVDLNEVRVSVEEGVVRLEGNTRSPTVNREVERVASSVRGCVSVENRLFSDWEIGLDAASRISRYAPTLLDRVVVKPQFGVLHLEGAIRDEGERQAVTQAVRATPGILDVQWPSTEGDAADSTERE